MANGNGKPNGIRHITLALYAIGCVLSGAGGNYLWLRTSGQEVVRPDPFTGSQAAVLVERIRHLEQKVDRHFAAHPDSVNRFDQRITSLEAQISAVLNNQNRILDRLERMNN